MPTRVRDPKRTRRKVLEAAYREFYRHGFQGGSLNNIVKQAGITKGALFHHFPGKNALAYAIIDEFLLPAVQKWWVEPLAGTDDPINAIKEVFKRFRQRVEQENPNQGFVTNGCPICNLAAEMSPLDEGFRTRLDHLYTVWRSAIAEALKRGQANGKVRPEVNPPEEAAFLVSSIAGTAATAKTAQELAHYKAAFRATNRYLEAMRA
jgi:AcrR family transcriptional regulator